MDNSFEFIYNIRGQIEESEEEFIYKSITPYCETIVEKRLSKKELENILRKGMQALKKGKWIMNSDFPDEIICSCCNTNYDMWFWEQGTMNYCPNCGAEMESKKRKCNSVSFEQQPCEDCISRANALRVANNEYLRGWHNALQSALGEKYSIHCEEGNFNVIQEETITGLGLSMDCAVGKDVESYMSAIPSVTPATNWIPVSERLPEKAGGYLVTSSINLGEKSPVREIYIDYFCKSSRKWLYEGEDVIAWKPLPEPYKAEMENEE